MAVQRRKSERPGEILQAAFEEFSQHGFAGTRLDDIATRANVTKGTIYVYFDSKETLFESMAQDLMTPVIQDIDKLLAFEPDSPEEVLRAFLSFAYDNVTRDRQKRELIRLLVLESRRFPQLTRAHYAAFTAPVLNKLKSLLTQFRDDQKIRDAAALDIPEIFLGPAISLTVWRLLFSDAPEIDTDEHKDAILDVLLRGLIPPEKTI